MATPYFEEVQRLRDNAWIFVLIAVVALASLAPLVYGLYWQVGRGIPWGDKPMTDEALIILTIFILITVIVMVFMLANLKLETRIDSEGVHYRMFPIKRRWKTIKPSDIVDYSLDRRYKLFEKGGVGFHRNILKKTTSLKIWGGKHITIQFHDGHKIMLGTQNLDGIEWAMRKLKNKTTVN
jgi:hypothetical protein